MLDLNKFDLEKCKPEVKAALMSLSYENKTIPDELKRKVFIFVEKSLGSIEEAEKALGYNISNIAPGKGEIKRNKKTRIAEWTIDNTRIALTSILNATVKLNLFSARVELTGLEAAGHTDFTDLAANHIRFQLIEKHKFNNIGKRDLIDIIEQIAHENRYHPVKDYLVSLKWDNVPRIDTWLIRMAGAEDSVYTRAVSSLTLKALVARVFTPGCKYDELLTLISETQGYLKSEALKILAGKTEWFTDSLKISADQKTFIEETEGKWIIEFAEMDGLSSARVDSLKASLSRQVDRARRSYARLSENAPRQFISIGTSNTRNFLSDPSGNRRYWPLEISRPFDLEMVKAERDQLFAEAYHRVVNLKESIRLDPSLYGEATKVQERHEVESPLLDILAVALRDKKGFVEMPSLWSVANVPTDQRKGRKDLAKAMSQLGWIKSQKKQGKTPIDGYYNESKEWLVLAKDPLTGCFTLISEEEAEERRRQSQPGITKKQIRLFDGEEEEDDDYSKYPETKSNTFEPN